MSKLSRRDILKRMGVTASAAPFAHHPLMILLESILYGFGNPALAESLQNNEKFYANFQMEGGPPRWFFDLPLIVDPNCDELAFNKSVITSFKTNNSAQGGEIVGEYAVHPYKGLYLPKMWSQYIPTTSGVDIPMTSLADNALFVRGLVKANAHTLAKNETQQPIAGGISLNSLPQEKSKLPISAVQFLSQMQFNSRNGASILVTEGKNPFAKILNAFDLDDPESFKRSIASETEIEKSIDEILHMLSYNAKNSSKRTNNMYNDRKNAKKLFKRGVEGLVENYPAYYSKYLNLAYEATQTNRFPGLDDKPIIAPGGIDPKWEVVGQFIKEGVDLRDCFKHSHNTRLAISSSIAEFIFTEKLSPSFTSDIPWFGGSFECQDKNGVSVGNRIASADAHHTGVYPTLIAWTRNFTAVMACMNELKSSLAKKGIWDKSIIHLSGDFNRKPRFDASGSDHYGNGSNVTIFSGMFNKPMLTGNCVTGKPVYKPGTVDEFVRYPGDFGHAAPMETLNNRTISCSNVASTISQLLGVESPTSNDESLLTKVNNEYRPVEKAKNIPHSSVTGGKVCKLKS